jgi:hypothetical protein
MDEEIGFVFHPQEEKDVPTFVSVEEKVVGRYIRD